jgi:hypothetical protein
MAERLAGKRRNALSDSWPRSTRWANAGRDGRREQGIGGPQAGQPLTLAFAVDHSVGIA